MRVALLTQDYPPATGGIETFCAHLAQALAQHDDLVTVVAPARPGAAAYDAQQPFRTRRLRVRPDLLGVALLARWPAWAAWLRPDVALHAQWTTAAASLLARRLTGHPHRVAVVLHGRELLFTPFGGPAARAYDALRRAVLREVDVLLPNSRFTARLAQRIAPEARLAAPIGMGVDPERFRPRDVPRAGGRLVTVCRLVPRKGVADVIEAVARLAARHPELRYDVGGEGPERAHLEALAAARGVAERVRFLGRVPDEALPALYAGADVVVMVPRADPVDVEGFGIVYLEAAACGRPVVASWTGGVPDAVVDGETGLLVPPGDPDALAAALDRLLGDPDLARRLGEQGRARVRAHYTWGHVADRVREALRSASS